MDQNAIGKMIAQSRRSAGYTQQDLAELLGITDKAVSKWERGICMPDSSLLTKLSMLLDIDIEHLISGKAPYGDTAYQGAIICSDLDHEIAGKPLVHYLLSYFMLAGIREVSITTDDKAYIRSLDFSQYGIRVTVDGCPGNRKTLVVYGKFLLFGANLTRYFHHFLEDQQNIIPVLDGIELPMLFTSQPQLDVDWHKTRSERKLLGRGIVFIPLETEEEMNDASTFIGIYEKYHRQRIADLQEISVKRGLV